jgi:hypothetical protein
MKIYDNMILFAIAYILFVSSKVRAERLSMSENVGGGRVYGEYNNGPYKVGAEHNWDEELDTTSFRSQKGFHWDEGEANVGDYRVGVEFTHTWDEMNQEESNGPKHKLLRNHIAKYNQDQSDENVGGGRVYGEFNKGPIKVGGEHNWDENAAHRHNMDMHNQRQINQMRKKYNQDESDENVGETKCMFIGGQCPFNGKRCCQGKPPWSNQYKVKCINGRCTKKAKCMFIGGQCPFDGKKCCQGRPPWSNQYKVDCINGRCKRIRK